MICILSVQIIFMSQKSKFKLYLFSVCYPLQKIIFIFTDYPRYQDKKINQKPLKYENA